MEVALIGLPGSGKTVVFCALTGFDFHQAGAALRREGGLLCVVNVPDVRVDRLSELYRPQKTTYAQLSWIRGGGLGGGGGGSKKDDVPAGSGRIDLGPKIRQTDALALVVSNFNAGSSPADEVNTVESELMISDLVVVEARLDRLSAERQRGRKADPEEKELLETARAVLDQGRPLRLEAAIATSPKIKGFGLLSAKPRLIIVNNADEDPDMPPLGRDVDAETEAVVVRGRLEMELSQMEPEDAAEFAADFGFDEPASGRVIALAYKQAGRISFYTVGEDEVRAWTVRRGDVALDAAGTVHTDMAKGFIRAEVISVDDLIRVGSLSEARKRALLRLEGKQYPVADGEVMHFRFNV